MDNNITTSEQKSTEPLETQIPMRWGQRSMWLVMPSFMIFALSLSSIFTLTRKFPADLFVDNWLPWFVAGFFTIGWLLTHWLEIVAFRRQRQNTRILVLVIFLISLVFGIYFDLIAKHQVLSQFGFTSAFLIWSGCAFRMSAFNDESYVFLQKNNWLGK